MTNWLSSAQGSLPPIHINLRNICLIKQPVITTPIKPLTNCLDEEFTLWTSLLLLSEETFAYCDHLPSNLHEVFHKTKTEHCCSENFFCQSKCISLLYAFLMHPSLWYKQVNKHLVANEIKQQQKREPRVCLSTITHFLSIVRSFGCHSSVFPWKSNLKPVPATGTVQRKASALEINQAALTLKTSPPTSPAKINLSSHFRYRSKKEKNPNT